jgi:clan AA aspartic protease (TIGR02281 family)
MQGFFRFAGVAGFLAILTSSVAQAQPDPSGFLHVAMQKHTAGTFYIEGAIEGYGDMQLLVDTGSSFLVINENILATLKQSGDAKYSHDLSGSMADGTRRIIPVYRLTGIRLGKSCYIRDIEAAVFPASSRPILGMNVLGRLAPFTFSADPPQLGLNQCAAQGAPGKNEDFASMQVERPAAPPKTTGVSQ